MHKTGYVYIITDKHHTLLYVGVTSDLTNRILQHKNKTYKNSFSARYNLDKLVYHEHYDSISTAIEQEKRLKAGSGRKKEELICKMNPGWKDLFESLFS